MSNREVGDGGVREGERARERERDHSNYLTAEFSAFDSTFTTKCGAHTMLTDRKPPYEDIWPLESL